VRRRALLVVAGAVVVWLVVANNLPAQQGPAADWSRPRVIQSAGITAYYPAAWRASMDGNTLVIWSGGDPKHRPGEFANHIPDGAVWIFLFNHGPMKYESSFPPRPEQFEIGDDDVRSLSCGFGFDGWNLMFVDHGSAVQALIGLGEGARKSDVTTLLDRLVIASPRVRLAT
jgi:hypothetical protein